MTKQCTKYTNMFYDKCHYFPNAPFEVIMEEPKSCEDFCEVLKRCIETGKDETIEKYGTIPPESFDDMKIYID